MTSPELPALEKNCDTMPSTEYEHYTVGLDFRALIDIAKTWNIHAYEQYDNMIGSQQIWIGGKLATVGWVRHRDFQAAGHRQNETPSIEVTNPGGEDVVIVEGSLSARVMPVGGGRRDMTATARGERPGFMQFDGGDTVWLTVPEDQTEPTWYVCFFPGGPKHPNPYHSGFVN